MQTIREKMIQYLSQKGWGTHKPSNAAIDGMVKYYSEMSDEKLFDEYTSQVYKGGIMGKNYWVHTPNDPWGCEQRCIHCGAGDDDSHSFSCPTNMHPDKRAELEEQIIKQVSQNSTNETSGKYRQ